MFGAQKRDIESQKFKAMDAFRDEHDAMPDGAFFAMAEEQHGWDAEDWGWFNEVEELNE